MKDYTWLNRSTLEAMATMALLDLAVYSTAIEDLYDRLEAALDSWVNADRSVVSQDEIQHAEWIASGAVHYVCVTWTRIEAMVAVCRQYFPIHQHLDTADRRYRGAFDYHHTLRDHFEHFPERMHGHRIAPGRYGWVSLGGWTQEGSRSGCYLAGIRLNEAESSSASEHSPLNTQRHF